MKTTQRLTMLAALAQALHCMPASAQDLVMAAPQLDARQTKAAKTAQECAHANRTGLNRRARRIMASKVRRGT